MIVALRTLNSVTRNLYFKNPNNKKNRTKIYKYVICSLTHFPEPGTKTDEPVEPTPTLTVRIIYIGIPFSFISLNLHKNFKF